MSGFKLPPTALESLFLGLYLLMSVGEILGNSNGVKVVVKEGSDAVLPCLISTEEDLTGETFDWKKYGQKGVLDVHMYASGQYDANRGQNEQFKGRVSHFQDQLMNGNASIKIQNTKVADSGNYSCEFPLLQPSKLFITELIVERLLKDRSGEIPGASKPLITIIYGQLQLRCEVQGASPEPKVEWQDSSGNILPAEEPQVSERGGSYNVTLKTTVTKTGRYRCVVTQEELKHQTSAETGMDISGASPKPYITTLDETKDWSLLQCEVEGVFPEPKVEWQDGSGNILPAEEPQVSERGGRYYVTIKTTVTKTDRYRCVVTQQDIKHQIYSETFKFINAASPEPYNTTLNVKKDQLVPQCDVREVSPKPTVELQDSSGNILPAEELQVSERGVNQSSVPEKFCEDCSTKVDYGWLFLAFVLGALFHAAIPFVLRATKDITVCFNRGAAPESTTTSADLTKDTPLLQVGDKGDHQNENGSSKAPPEMPPV